MSALALSAASLLVAFATVSALLLVTALLVRAHRDGLERVRRDGEQ